MIITRTPFRVSFVGGGTDIADYYIANTGAVVSVAIDKFMYIIVNKRYDATIRISYTKTEIVNNVDEIEHPLVREELKLVGIDSGIEIVSIADIPAGTGLGSSSSFAVGLLNALYAYKGIKVDAEELAQQACRLEIDILGEPIGKQDQYIAAYGGFRYIQFNPDHTVLVEPLYYSRADELSKSLLLFRINGVRSGREILCEQKANIKNRLAEMRQMYLLARYLREELRKDIYTGRIGRYLHDNWELKKSLASGISTKLVDGYYDKARTAGAVGGKICGEGGNGYLLLYCPFERQDAVKAALGLPCTEVMFEPEGSKVIHVC